MTVADEVQRPAEVLWKISPLKAGPSVTRAAVGVIVVSAAVLHW